MFRYRRATFGLLLVLAGVATAVAQSAAPGQRQSLLEIFWLGIELPTYLIVAGSFAAAALVVEHFVSVRRINIAPADAVARARAHIEARRFRECLDDARGDATHFGELLAAALTHARHGFDAMHEAALEKSSELTGRLFRKAEYLNIIGNLGPLLGLLGTVWGMIEAFGELGAAGGAGGQLAGGISKALVNTLAGLALAIVGIGFYGVCRNRIDALTTAATVEVLDLLEYFRPVAAESRVAATAPTAAAAPPLRPRPVAPKPAAPEAAE